MIRYEFEEDFVLHHDSKMPIPRNEAVAGGHGDHHPIGDPHWTSSMEADWLNSDDPAHQIDQYAQSLLTGDFPFDGFDHSHGEPFGDSLFDSHHSSYYDNSRTEEPALMSTSQYHEAQGVHPPSSRPPLTPLRERDLNVPVYTPPKRIVVEKEKPPKPIKAPVQRRPIDEFPTKNGFKKPLFSYSCLIGLAMRNSERGELTVSEIYRFLCVHFPFFQEAPSGWKNSVRHNLSLNKCFQKVEPPINDTQIRRSCLWRINPSKADKMAAEINKWRDRCGLNIEQSMDNPADLDAIISGSKGMPPPEEGEQNEWMSVSNGRQRDPVVYIKPEKLRRAESRLARRSASFSSPPPPKPKARVIIRPPKLEAQYDPVDEFLNMDENYPPNSPPKAGPSSVVVRPVNSSVHERAARTFESLLERKKLATVHPRSDEINIEPEEYSPQRHFEHPIGRLPSASPLRVLPGAMRLSKTVVHRSSPYTIGHMGASDSPALPRRLTSPNVRPMSSQR